MNFGPMLMSTPWEITTLTPNALLPTLFCCFFLKKNLITHCNFFPCLLLVQKSLTIYFFFCFTGSSSFHFFLPLLPSSSVHFFFLAQLFPFPCNLFPPFFFCNFFTLLSSFCNFFPNQWARGRSESETKERERKKQELTKEVEEELEEEFEQKKKIEEKNRNCVWWGTRGKNIRPSRAFWVQFQVSIG